jgi:two-component system sensor histidine kinase HydH
MKKRPGPTRADDPSTLRPGYLATLAGVLVLVLGIFAWYESGESRRIMLDTLREGSTFLAQAAARAGENALRADREIQVLVAQRLRDNARLIKALEERESLADSTLAHLTGSNPYTIDLVDEHGYLLATTDPYGEGTDLREDDLRSILDRTTEVDVFWLPEEDLYAVAVQRPGGGAVVVQADADWLLELRRASGMGRLIQEIGAIGDNEGIVYTLVQDELGLLSASRGVQSIGPIEGDPFLEQAVRLDSAVSRLTQFDGQEIFETVLPFASTADHAQLLRIGFSLENLRIQESRSKVQLALLVGLLGVLGAVGAGIVTVRQNYALLDEAYDRVQTYSSRILERMADAVVALDPSGRISVFNHAAERLFELRAPAALNQPWRSVFGDDLDTLEQSLAMRTELQNHACSFQLPTGREVTLALSTSRLEEEDGETVVVVIQDLTEKAALEADLRRRDRLTAMGALASGVAHEVRNPLNAIGIIVQRLEREFVPTADAEEYGQLTRLVRDEVRRVNGIIVDFLDLARPRKLQLQPVDLEPLLEKAAQVIAPQVAAKGLQLVRQFEVAGRRIEADPDQLHQALLNLLTNAVEATDQGSVKLGARLTEAGLVEIEIADTGTGIPPEDIERVFDLYFTTKPEGTGLGLGLVHRIIAEHGGRLEIQSQSGQGTRITLLLPRGD